jgi:IS1 family transposase
LLPVFVVGKRTLANARKLIEKLDAVTDETIPFFTSDELRHYERALLEVYGVVQEVPRQPGKRGRPPEPIRVPPKELRYAQVVKEREKGRVVDVRTQVIFGDAEEIRQFLEKSPVSNHINTAFVERNNLSLRQYSKRLARKTNAFSKDVRHLEGQLYVASAYYHLVKPHLGLRLHAHSQNRKWLQRTPAMAADITEHIWSTRELLVYRVP